MELKNLARLTRSLIRELRSSLFNTKVTNFPETQKVEITNPTEAQETVEVSNLIDVKPELKKVVKAIEDKVQLFDNSAQKKDIVKAIKELKQTPVKDLTPDVIKGIDKTVKLLEKLAKAKPDYREIVKALDKGEPVDNLEKYARYDEIKTRFNEKQLKELKDTFKSISVGGGSGGGPKDLKVNGHIVDSTHPVPVDITGDFGIPAHDLITITYVAAGDGAGEIETVVYSKSATTVATLTLAYNSDDKLTDVTHS